MSACTDHMLRIFSFPLGISLIRIGLLWNMVQFITQTRNHCRLLMFYDEIIVILLMKSMFGFAVAWHIKASWVNPMAKRMETDPVIMKNIQDHSDNVNLVYGLATCRFHWKTSTAALSHFYAVEILHLISFHCWSRPCVCLCDMWLPTCTW